MQLRSEVQRLAAKQRALGGGSSVDKQEEEADAEEDAVWRRPAPRQPQPLQQQPQQPQREPGIQPPALAPKAERLLPPQRQACSPSHQGLRAAGPQQPGAATCSGGDAIDEADFSLPSFAELRRKAAGAWHSPSPPRRPAAALQAALPGGGACARRPPSTVQAQVSPVFASRAAGGTGRGPFFGAHHFS
jgi:hypothetical protein